MATEESVTITETAPDGTETTIEITTRKDDNLQINEDGESLVEEVVEALLDVEIDDDNAEDFDSTDYNLTEGDELNENEVYSPETDEDFENTEIDSDNTTFHRGDYTDIGTGSDGETTYVIGEDFSYID